MCSISLKLFAFLVTVASSLALYSPEQQHLGPENQASNQPTLLPYPQAWAHCVGPSRWKCRLTFFAVWCSCEIDPILSNGHEETTTSLEITAQVQPGNNDTLVSLFELQCEEKSAVGCVSTGGGSFTCGCHTLGCNGHGLDLEGGDDSDTVPIGLGGHAVQEIGAQAAHGGFQFKKIRFPRCNKPGFHIKCCTVGRKSQCFCAGNEQRCP